jgi:VWFA-related protein
MRKNVTFVRQTLAGLLLLAVFAGLALASVSSRAQEDVTGTPPSGEGAQENPSSDETSSAKRADIRVQSALVTTPVTAVDSSGQFVFDLTEEDFRVLDNGVPQRLERFEPAVRPLAAVILVQTNHAVAPLLDQVRPLGPMFSGLLLGPQGQAAVLAYDDRVRLMQDFSSDGEQLKSTLQALTPRGDLARLNDALARGIALLEKRPKTERRIIVIFSDGSDHGSETGKEEVVRRATGAEVTIYGLGFSATRVLLSKKPELPAPGPLDTNVTRPLPPGTVPTPSASVRVYDAPIPVVDILVATGQIIRSSLASNLLEFYAGYTGGIFYSHWSKKKVEEQLARIATEIHSQYELAYVPDTVGQSGFHHIEVQVRRPGVKVRARAGYFYQPLNP